LKTFLLGPNWTITCASPHVTSPSPGNLLVLPFPVSSPAPSQVLKPFLLRPPSFLLFLFRIWDRTSPCLLWPTSTKILVHLVQDRLEHSHPATRFSFLFRVPADPLLFPPSKSRPTFWRVQCKMTLSFCWWSRFFFSSLHSRPFLTCSRSWLRLTLLNVLGRVVFYLVSPFFLIVFFFFSPAALPSYYASIVSLLHIVELSLLLGHGEGFFVQRLIRRAFFRIFFLSLRTSSCARFFLVLRFSSLRLFPPYVVLFKSICIRLALSPSSCRGVNEQRMLCLRADSIFSSVVSPFPPFPACSCRSLLFSFFSTLRRFCGSENFTFAPRPPPCCCTNPFFSYPPFPRGCASVSCGTYFLRACGKPPNSVTRCLRYK